MRAPVYVFLLLAAAPLTAPLPAWAQIPQRIRGTIASLSGDTLIVREADGGDATLHLAANVPVREEIRATAAAITPGSTLAIVSRGPADKQEAIDIRVVPAGSLARMGVFKWDLPQSTMTNGVVEGQSVAVSGGVLTVKAADSVVHMAIAPNASISVSGPGDASMLTPGAHVVVFATPGTGGVMTGQTVIVGKDGMTPPL